MTKRKPGNGGSNGNQGGRATAEALAIKVGLAEIL